MCCLFFFFNDTATTEIYTLSLHDALPISSHPHRGGVAERSIAPVLKTGNPQGFVGSNPTPSASLQWKSRDRKSTRLNSSHANISYAVFCLKKKKIKLRKEEVTHISTLKIE